MFRRAQRGAGQFPCHWFVLVRDPASGNNIVHQKQHEVNAHNMNNLIDSSSKLHLTMHFPAVALLYIFFFFFRN